MPAGTDLITWSPRIGATGDDRYDPGETIVSAGDYAGFSTLPTLAEVNASSGINQVKAEIARRTWTADYLRPGSYITVDPGYVDPEKKILSTHFNPTALIDTIRAGEGSSVFPWTSLPSSRISRQRMLELRKALATDHIQLFRYKSDHYSGINIYNSIRGWFGAYPAIHTYDISVSAGPRAGEISSTLKIRGYLHFRMPSLPANMTAKLNCWYTRGNVDVTEIYKSNSFLGPIDTGDWGNLDTLVFSDTNSNFAATAGTKYKVTLDLSCTPSGGENISLIFTMQKENTNGGPYNSYDQIVGGSGGEEQPLLKLWTP